MMNIRTQSLLSRAARIAAGSLLAVSAIGTGASGTLAANGGNSGAIWTTANPCSGGSTQDVNLYAVGDVVYLHGNDFAANLAVAWTITGLPGGASADPGAAVASGTGTADVNGSFCIATYTVAADDWGVYSVDVAQGRSSKNDNYRVNRPTSGSGTGDTGGTTGGTGDSGQTGGTGGTTDGASSGSDTGGNGVSGSGDTGGTTGDTGSTGGTTDTGPTGDTTDGSGPGSTGGSTTLAPVNGPSYSTDVLGETDTNPVTTAVPSSSVAGVIDRQPSIPMPSTDTVVPASSSSPSLLVLLLAALTGAAILFAPTLRRTAHEGDCSA